MSSNGYVTRDSIFANPPQRRFVDVEVEGFGKVRIRSLTAREKTKYDAGAINKKGQMDTRGLLTANVRLIILCCVDGEGNAMFTSADLEPLQDMDAGTIEDLAGKCGDHCGMTDDEDAGKN